MFDKANGSTYTTGANNRLLSDGTHRYLYDAEGNRTHRFIDANQNGQLDSGDSDITQYTWDHRNRLVKVEHRASYAAAVDKVVEYFYDYQNRWVRKALDGDGDGHLDGRRIFLYDGNQMVMDFQRANSEDMQIGHLRQRYLWGPAVDQILAEEAVDGGTADLVQWTLTDHLNTVRDIAQYDPETGATTVVNHLVYDAFGRVTSESNPPVDSLFLFTARPFDADTQLQNNRNRWYDASVGRWLSQDPIGFTGGDPNLYRYALNAPLLFLDLLGLKPGITGACHVSIYAGHGIWPIGRGVEDPAVSAFRREHDVPNPDIVTGCGNYVGYVGCEGSRLNAGVTTGRRIPGMPRMGRMMAKDMLPAVQHALAAARAPQKTLCENRKKFCDDGTPQRYKCGVDMQRCDTVTISVTCDADMKVLMETGIYQKRLFPGGPVVAAWPVPGLPTKESLLVCGLSETMECNK